MNRVRRLLFLLSCAVLAIAFTPTSAQAAADPTRNGICDDGEICFYFNSNQGGVLSDMNYPLGDYKSGAACNHFLKPGGTATSTCLKNNSASVWNRTKQIAVVYYNSGYGGPSQSFDPGVKANFDSTLKNQNASHTFKDVPPPPPPFDRVGTTDRLLFGPMDDFVQARDNVGVGLLRWDTDYCSVPIVDEPKRSQPRGYDFRNACVRHDFGLHNYFDQGRLDETNFQRINDNFKNDTYGVCSQYKGWSSWKGVECRRIADIYTAAVRQCGAPWSQCMERLKGLFDWI